MFREFHILLLQGYKRKTKTENFDLDKQIPDQIRRRKTTKKIHFIYVCMYPYDDIRSLI